MSSEPRSHSETDLFFSFWTILVYEVLTSLCLPILRGPEGQWYGRTGEGTSRCVRRRRFESGSVGRSGTTTSGRERHREDLWSTEGRLDGRLSERQEGLSLKVPPSRSPDPTTTSSHRGEGHRHRKGTTTTNVKTKGIKKERNYDKVGPLFRRERRSKVTPYKRCNKQKLPR